MEATKARMAAAQERKQQLQGGGGAFRMPMPSETRGPAPVVASTPSLSFSDLQPSASTLPASRTAATAAAAQGTNRSGTFRMDLSIDSSTDDVSTVVCRGWIVCGGPLRYCIRLLVMYSNVSNLVFFNHIIP